MNLILEEYGVFILEIIGGMLLLGIVITLFFQGEMRFLVEEFLTSVLGGGI